METIMHSKFHVCLFITILRFIVLARITILHDDQFSMKKETACLQFCVSSKNIPYGKTTCQKKYQSNFFIFVSSWFLCLSLLCYNLMGPVGPGSCSNPMTQVTLWHNNTKTTPFVITGCNTKAFTFSFFPRLNFPSETRILLLYLTVPALIFKFISLGNI